MITTVLLDAGGVLLDETEHEERWAAILCDLAGISREQYDRDVAESVRVYVPRVYRYVLWKYTRPDARRLEALWAEGLERYRADRPALRVMPGIGDELRAMHGKLGLGIAGQYGAELLDALDGEGLLDLLSWRLTQDDFALTKPDPRYFTEIAAACGVRPEECIEVGDRIDKDVIPAKQAGMRTILVRTGIHRNQVPRLPEEIPDRDLPSVSGIARAALGIESGLES